MKAKMRWLILLLVLLAGLSVSGVAKAEPCLLSALPPTGQSTTDWYLFVEFTSPEYVLVSFGPWSFGSYSEANKNLTPPTEDFKKRIRAIGKVKVVGIYLDQLIPEGAYLPIYTPQQFAQFDGSNGLSLPGMTSDLAAVTSGQPPQIIRPSEDEVFEVELGKEWSFRIQATDPEGDPLYYNMVAFNYPRDMYIWDLNGLIRWKPRNSDLLGKQKAVFTVSDTPGFTCQVMRTFYVNVVAPPDTPPTEPPPVTTPPSTRNLVTRVNGYGRVMSSPSGMDCQGTVHSGSTGSFTVCSVPMSSGSTVTLTATPSSGNWRVKGGCSSSSTLGASTTCTVTMDTEKTVDIIFGFGSSPPSPNQVPVAKAGTDQATALVGGSANFCLNGSGSYDPDGGSIVSYVWTGTVNPADTSNPCLTVRTVGVYSFTLMVTDDEGSTDTSMMTVVVIGEPPSGNQGNQGQQNPPAETNPAGGGQANPTAPVQTGAGQGTGTTSQPVSDQGNNNPGSVEVPVSGSNPEPGVVIPLEPDGGEPTGGTNPPPSNNTDNANPDNADLQEIQRQLDEIQNRVNELEAEVTRVLGDSSTIKPAEPASLGLLEIPPGFRFEQDLRRGDKSDDVKYLQILLNSDPDTRLADSGPGSPGKETVNFGDRTESAVIRFQEKYADEILKPIGYRKGTGFLGPRTREVLNRILESKSLSSLEPHGNAVPILPVVEPEDVLRALNTLNTATAILPTKAAGKFALGKITGLLKETAIALARKDLPKVKQRLDEAVEWARKPFKQAPKLTSTQQAAIAPYVARYGDRVLEYAQKYGDHGVRLLERAGKQIGVRAERFINEKEWVFHFNKHKVDTGLPWLGREFTSKEEYLAEAKSVITNPNSKKVLYYHQSNLNDPTLGYLLEREGKVFLVAVNDAGNIKTFHYLKEGWGYVQEGPVWNKLFKVDPF